MSDDFPEPWWQPAGPDRERLRDEVLREIPAEGHVLSRRGFEVIARCDACDEVLLRLDDESQALVHPTWSGQAESPPWPMTRLTGGYIATEAAVTAHAVEHG